MSKKIVQLNEEVIKGEIKELVRGSVQKSAPQPHLHAVLAPPCRSFSPTFTH